MELTLRDLRKWLGDGVARLYIMQGVCNFYLWYKKHEGQAYNVDAEAAESVVPKCFARHICSRGSARKRWNPEANMSCSALFNFEVGADTGVNVRDQVHRQALDMQFPETVFEHCFIGNDSEIVPYVVVKDRNQ